METTTLGRTGLDVSVVGLGCGGHSRLGLGYGKDEKHAVNIVKHAIEQGINFIDTARAYRTERAVGIAAKGNRGSLVISTKSLVAGPDGLFTAADIVESLNKSLANLQTDYIDVFNLHGVTAEQYPHCVNELLPALKREQQAGKFRFIGITETFVADPSHKMLQLALPDDDYDVVMVGFNLLNPSARKTVFPTTIKKNVATQIMFAVRRALSQPEALQEVISQLIDSGELEASLLDKKAALAFLENHPEVKSIVEAAYRFCRYEPGATVVLTGTGSKEHLDDNIQSILAPPLPEILMEKLNEIFGEVDSVSGN